LTRERLEALLVFVEENMTERQSQGRSPLEGERARNPRAGSAARSGTVALGLTGGIGAGKSTALAIFRELGALTVSADELVHELYGCPEVSADIGLRFGSDVLDEEGKVNRARLAALVRGRREELRWLEDLVHPLVGSAIERRIDTAPIGTVVVCEVPLLFESGLDRLFDLVVTVEADRDVRRERSIHGFDSEMFADLESLQASTEERTAASDLCFHNDGDIGHLREFVRGAYSQALELIAESR
jgi:dephospho-CoA kinase